MQEFDLLRAQLNGHIMIEANAGTGKTYSIAHIYLRLLLEQDFAVEQILVLTFTRAATAELKSRIHASLAAMLAALEGADTTDPFIAHLRAKCVDEIPDAKARLHTALRRFDLAMIETIHGFCHKTLTEAPMATGFDPALTLVELDRVMIKSLLRRAWRQASSEFSWGFAAYLKRCNRSPESISTVVMDYLRRPAATLILPASTAAQIVDLESVAMARLATLRAYWAQDQSALLSGAKKPLRNAAIVLNRHLGLSQPCAFELGGSVAALLDQQTVPLLGRALADYLAVHRPLLAAYRAWQSRLTYELAHRIRPMLHDWKQRHRVRYYDDLLVEFLAALGAPANALQAVLRQRYPAALVDEFQDTDPLQYQILDTIYSGSDCPRIFVGDPKQALYAFRGADVFAYIHARDQAKHCYSLSTNWRAIPPLLECLNRLFTAVPRAFVLPQIGYLPSLPAAVPIPALQLDEPAQAPLICWQLPTQRATKPALQTQAAAAMAASVVDLLQQARDGRARLGERPLAARDIAVLVRNHKQGQLAAQALSAAGINAVQPGIGSVFDSEEADELEWVLRAIAYPELPGRIPAALATRLLGVAAAALDQNEAENERYYELFAQYHHTWLNHGLAALLLAIMREHHVASRWLALSQGQRRLTNLYHLCELLQDRSLSGGPAELLQWFAERRATASEQMASEEELLRLESDEDLVQILTIHKAKGMQFPIVFCPFTWDASSHYDKFDEAMYHDADDNRLCIDAGGPHHKAHQERGLEERYAEDMRVLYVALTRAIHRCYFVWGAAAGAEFAALRYLLHGQGDDWRDGSSLLKKAGDNAPEVAASAAEKLRALGIHTTPLPQPVPTLKSLDSPGERQPRVRALPTLPEPAWALHSFSSVTTGNSARGKDRDWSPDANAHPTSPQAMDIFSVPGGTRTGSMLHEVLEDLASLDEDRATIESVVARKSVKYGISAKFTGLLARHLHECLETVIGEEELRLCDLPRNDYVRELAFFFASDGIALERLFEWIRGPGDHPRQLLAEGYFRGYIDLIFYFKKKYYIIDYKSNYLGNNLQDYKPSTLRLALMDGGYDLQYHLYALALHRHLRSRLQDYTYQRCFGGVYYLYLRGMRSATGPASGVFFDRPGQAIIDGLDRMFGGS